MAKLSVFSLSSIVPEDERWEPDDALESRKQRKEKKRKDGNTTMGADKSADEDAASVDMKVDAIEEEAESAVAEEVEGRAEEADGLEAAMLVEDGDDAGNIEVERPSSQASNSSVISHYSREHWTDKDEELSNIQPKLWQGHTLVVADPFIRSKV